MERDWLVCNRCRCGYSDSVRREGDPCGDLSWVPSGVYQRRRITVSVARRLSCKGRVWPVASERHRWNDERLLEWRRMALKAVIERN